MAPAFPDIAKCRDSTCKQTRGMSQQGQHGGARGVIRKVFSNWAGEFVGIASGFILPRLIHSHMSQAQLGIWDYGWSIRGLHLFRFIRTRMYRC